MANIKVTLNESMKDGMTVKFKAPCDCSEVNGLTVRYLIVDGDDITEHTQDFTLTDAQGNDLAGLGNLFAKDALVKVVLDTDKNHAYLVNSCNNSYVANHKHNSLYNDFNGIPAEVELVAVSGVYYFRPSMKNNVLLESTAPINLGSENFRWEKVYGMKGVFNDLAVEGKRIRCLPTYENTVTNSPNMFVGSSTGAFSRSTTTSSRTLKHDIEDLKNEDLLAENLYKLPVHQAKYNEDVITDKEDTRYMKDLPMFIIEEMDEIYPVAVDKPDKDDVKTWSWNAQYLIPPMLKLIQDLKKEVEELKGAK